MSGINRCLSKEEFEVLESKAIDARNDHLWRIIHPEDGSNVYLDDLSSGLRKQLLKVRGLVAQPPTD